MNVNPPLNGLSSPMANTGGTNNTSGSHRSDPLSDSSMFMQLLTAQLKNQSPLDPVQPSQFTQQLVELNMLDQLSQMNQTLQTAFPSKSASQGVH